MSENDEKSKKIIKEESKNNVEKDNNSIIIDNENKTFDIFSLLADKSNIVVIRLNNLYKFGITDQMIANLYKDSSSSVENEKNALETLEIVYRNIVRGINERPNGIILDFSGEQNVEESIKQKRAYGIDGDYGFIEVDKNKKIEFMSKENTIEKMWEAADKTTRSKIINDYVQSAGNIKNSFGNKNNAIEDKEELRKTGISELEINYIKASMGFVKIDSIVDINFTKAAFMLTEVIERQKRGYATDLSEMYNKHFEKLKSAEGSKYFSMILDEQGEIDPDKVVKFTEKWKEQENKVTLFEYLKNYNKIIGDMGDKYDVDSLDETNKKDLLTVLARGVLSQDRTINKMFEQVCKKLDIGTNYQDIIDFSVKHQIEPIIGKEDLEKIAAKGEFNNVNAINKLSEIKRGFTYTEEKRIVNSVFKSADVFSLVKGSNEDRTKAIVLLYNQCLKDDSYGKNSNPANFIKQYMVEHKEQFGEYLKQNGNGEIDVDRRKIYQLENLKGKSRADLKEFSKINVQMKIMKSQIDVNIPERKGKKHEKKVEKFRGQVGKLSEKYTKISDTQMDKLFKKAVVLDVGFEDLDSIRKLNETRFEHNMNTERKSSFFEPARRAIISAAFSIQNFVAMPISYVRSIQANKEQYESQESDNLPVVKDEKKGLFSKIAKLFKKKESEKQVIKSRRNKEPSFDERYKLEQTPIIQANTNLSNEQMQKANDDINRSSAPDSQDGEDIEY